MSLGDSNNSRITTGVRNGHVMITVEHHDSEPPLPNESWEDVGELSITTAGWDDEDDHVYALGAGDLDLDRPPFEGRLPHLDPPVYGDARLRVSAKGRGTPGKGKQDKVDEHYLFQSWPAPPAPPADIRTTSALGKHLLTECP